VAFVRDTEWASGGSLSSPLERHWVALGRGTKWPLGEALSALGERKSRKNWERH
jgi:hypothetical protein